MTRRSLAPLWIALALFAIEMALSRRYGVFRDELYYVACGNHLAFGYVDHPPLVAFMARLATLTFGQSVVALRVLPALCFGATCIVCAELTRTMGGGRWAQSLGALCVAVTPEFLGTGHFLSMNCVLPLAWTAAALFAARALAHDDRRAWILFGVACGFGLLAKHSTLFFGAGLALGLATTPARAALRTRGPWLGLAVAFAIFAPNLAWEQLHGWPTLEFMRNAQEHKMVRMGVLAFVRAQIDDTMPFTLPIWLGGTLWLLLSKRARPLRFLGVAFLAVYAIVVIGGGKPYYLAPVFPVVYAAGAIAIEERVTRSMPRAAVMGALVAGGAVIAPFAIPVLDEAHFIRYAAALHVEPASDEKHEKGLLPQFQADQHGWEAMATKVARAYMALSPDERRVATIYGGNYGEAGAIDWFGPRWNLPPAVSGHNAYAMWGPPRDGRGAVMIAVGDFACDDWSNVYASVTQVDATDDPYAMPYENHVPICVLRGPKQPLDEVWPRLRHYI